MSLIKTLYDIATIQLMCLTNRLADFDFDLFQAKVAHIYKSNGIYTNVTSSSSVL